MTDLATTLRTLRRPPLLVRAARIGATALGRTRGRALPAASHSVDRLLDEEAALNSARLQGEAAYSPTRHVEVLGALLCAAAGEPAQMA